MAVSQALPAICRGIYMKMAAESDRRKREIRRLEHRRRILSRIHANGEDILKSSNFQKTRRDIQHGTISVHTHCISVAGCSLEIMEMLEKMGVRIEERALVRGALLHDYFLYDWHIHPHGKGIRNLHGFRHPQIALENAGKEYRLSERERDIIRKHMWPLTVQPPVCREAWIVTAADKYCSLLETLRLRNEKRRTVVMSRLRAVSEYTAPGKRTGLTTGGE